MINIIFASTSGHTQFVVETLKKHWRTKGHTCQLIRAERATADDIQNCDLLVLASGTWNTGGQEGNLNPHMHKLLCERAKSINLNTKPVALISLGDTRYYFTTRCTEHFMKFLKEANGIPLSPPLIIVNEPYEQEDRIRAWGEKLLPKS